MPFYRTNALERAGMSGSYDVAAMRSSIVMSTGVFIVPAEQSRSFSKTEARLSKPELGRVSARVLEIIL